MRFFSTLMLLVFVSLVPIQLLADNKVPIGVVNTTAYCSGTTTASGIRVRTGHIALSRDLVKKLGARYGDKIYLEGHQYPYEFQDLMPPQWKNKMDVYMNRASAVEYGLKKRMAWLEKR